MISSLTHCRGRCARQLEERCIRRYKLEERNFPGSSVAVDTPMHSRHFCTFASFRAACQSCFSAVHGYGKKNPKSNGGVPKTSGDKVSIIDRKIVWIYLFNFYRYFLFWFLLLIIVYSFFLQFARTENAKFLYWTSRICSSVQFHLMAIFYRLRKSLMTGWYEIFLWINEGKFYDGKF